MIRNADRNDLEEIYSLSNLLEDTILDKEGFVLAYEDAIRNDVVCLLEEDEIIGYIHFRISQQLCRASRIMEILELVIKEEYREKGYGKLLLNRAEGYACENQIALIEVLSSSYRNRAHHFYESNGYENTGYRFFKRMKI